MYVGLHRLGTILCSLPPCQVTPEWRSIARTCYLSKSGQLNLKVTGGRPKVDGSGKIGQTVDREGEH